MAEGILEPQESLKLNFNQACVQSPLLHRLWASAVLCCIAGQCLARVSRSLGTPACSFMLCPKKHPDAASKHPDAVSCPGHGTSCPPLLSQPLLVAWSPPAKGAAAAVGGLGGGTAARSSWLWLRGEQGFEKTVSFISSVD